MSGSNSSLPADLTSTSTPPPPPPALASPSLPWTLPRLVALGLLVVVFALVALSLLNQYLIERAPIDQVIEQGTIFRTRYRLFHLDREMSIAAWFSSMMLAFSGTLMLIRAWRQKRLAQPDGWRWAMLGGAMFFLSADESAGIHEGAWQIVDPLLGHRLSQMSYIEPWIIPVVIVAALFLSLYIRFLFRLPRATRWGLIAAGVVYISGTVGVESVSAVVMGIRGGGDAASGGASALFVLWTVEETLEMLGLTILATTMVANLCHSPTQQEG